MDALQLRVLRMTVFGLGVRDKCVSVLGMCVLGMSVSIDGHHCAGGCHPQVGRGHALHDWQEGHQPQYLSPPQLSVYCLRFISGRLFVRTYLNGATVTQHS